MTHVIDVRVDAEACCWGTPQFREKWDPRFDDYGVDRETYAEAIRLCNVLLVQESGMVWGMFAVALCASIILLPFYILCFPCVCGVLFAAPKMWRVYPEKQMEDRLVPLNGMWNPRGLYVNIIPVYGQCGGSYRALRITNFPDESKGQVIPTIANTLQGAQPVIAGTQPAQPYPVQQQPPYGAAIPMHSVPPPQQGYPAQPQQGYPAQPQQGQPIQQGYPIQQGHPVQQGYPHPPQEGYPPANGNPMQPPPQGEEDMYTNPDVQASSEALVAPPPYNNS